MLLVCNSPQICSYRIHNSKGLLLNGLLGELPIILDSFSTVPQVIILGWLVGDGREP